VLAEKLGPYTLVRQIAVGGMAEIYLATVEKTTPQQQVAIKVIHQHNASDPDFVRMLVDEARLAVQLKHPNIVTTYDLGRQDEQYYIVMELVDGADLFKVQQRAADRGLPFPLALAAYIAREVCRGLDYAHRLCDSDGQPLQVVHRDISPQNILLALDGEVKIADFGIAKAARRSMQTQAGIIKGKYYYMSPEQAAGHPIDRRTDIFAAGILLYEMLIGEMLYYDEDVERLLQTVRKADIPLVSRRRPDTPLELERIVMKALRHNPADRYSSAGECALALDEFLRRFAPHVGLADLGSFVEDLIGVTGRGRSFNEPTTTMSVDAALIEQSRLGVSEISSSSGVSKLGVHDENSLIFNPQLAREHLGALLPSSTPPMGGGAPRSAARSSTAVSAQGRRDDDNSQLRTKQRFIEPWRPGVVDVRTKSDISTGALEAISPPSTTTPSGQTGDWGADIDALPMGQRAISSAPPLEPRRGSLQPSAVYPAILPEVEEDELAKALALAPEPRVLEPKRALRPPAPDGKRPNVVIPDGPEAEQRSRQTLPLPSRSVIADVDGQAQLELQQSDLAFSKPELVPVEPKVELQQSDEPYADAAVVTVESSTGHWLDAISAETTHENLRPPDPPPSAVSVPAPVAPSNLTAPRSQSLRPFVIAGLGATVLSAILTWYMIDSRRGSGPNKPQLPQVADLGVPGPSLPMLVLPPFDQIPAAEPPPAGFVADSPAPQSPTPSGKPDAAAEPEETGQLSIDSEPSGAQVFVDKQLKGVTPLVLRDLPLSKEVKVELRLPGYKHTRKRIKWRGKTSLEVVIPLALPTSTEPEAAAP